MQNVKTVIVQIGNDYYVEIVVPFLLSELLLRSTLCNDGFALLFCSFVVRFCFVFVFVSKNLFVG